MNAAFNFILILVAGYLVLTMLYRDTSIAKLPEQGGLQKATLAAG